MDHIDNRPLAEGFYRALASRDGHRIGSFLSKEVDWMSMGPVEMLSFCGPRRGRAEVVEVIAEMTAKIQPVPETCSTEFLH